MAAVSLHPLASRSGAQTSTIVSIDLPQQNAEAAGSDPHPLSSSAPVDHAATAYSRHPGPALTQNGLTQSDETARTSSEAFASSPTMRALSPGNIFAENDPRPEWGISHSDLQQYNAIDDRDVPIRMMNAAQYAEIQQRYAALDVPHDVVFPFLHGVDGDNAAQCAFFRAPMTGQPTPHYRGLTVVRADMPAPHQRPTHKRASSSISTSAHDAQLRSRADSLATTASSFTSIDHSEDGSLEERVQSTMADAGPHASPADRRMTESKSTTSTIASNLSRASSLFSNVMTPLDEGFGSTTGHGNRRNGGRIPHGEPQPMHSMLSSSILPDELVNPPLLQSKTNPSALHVATQAMRFEEFDENDTRVVRDACFVRPRQADGISLRNFKTQCAKYATISDIIVYCPAGLHDGVLTLAHWIRTAQDQVYEDRTARGLGGLRYNVFVINDSFDAFEQHFPHLVAVDGSGFSRNRIDFVEREREEMQRFTEASEIEDNIFMGCTANVPFSFDEYEGHGSRDLSSISLDSCSPEDANPHAFSVCIEAIEMGELPDSSSLSNATQILDSLEVNADTNAAFTYNDCAIGEGKPSLGPGGWSPRLKARSASSGSAPCPHFTAANSTASLPSVACNPIHHPAPSDIIHLKALGSAMYLESEMAVQEAVDRIVNLCIWMWKEAHPQNEACTSPYLAGRSGSSGPFSPSLFHTAWRRGAMTRTASPSPKRILIHCGDGYTDSSLLGLAYLMYARRLSLPEAYLDLQNRCQRCFFVYARDVPFLQRIERRISEELWHVRFAEEEHHSRSTSPLSSRRSASRRAEQQGNDTPPDQSVWARSLAAASGLVGGRTTTPIPRRTTPTPTRSPVMRPITLSAPEHSWFLNSNFQGSFPSRILPFLYLGNLSHALNPGMLHALGITHVVSVGESALLPPTTEHSLFDAAVAAHSMPGNTSTSAFARAHRQQSGRSGVPQHASLWEEERNGRISVLDLKNVSDDGIDSLRPHMKRAVEYIEQARLQGGKVLVHCRVGVSRSATICIAYVMAHCDLSMIESFLLVRSRRMNVLTQPTLLFVWELRGFESHLAHLKARRGQQSRTFQLQPQLRGVEHIDLDESGDRQMRDVSTDDTISLAALSISSNEQSGDQSLMRGLQKDAKSRNHSTTSSRFSLQGDEAGDSKLPAGDDEMMASLDYLQSDALDMRQSIFYHEDLRVDVGAGAGNVYGFTLPNVHELPFNSGSLTGLPYLSAKLTHGYFCKVLSELNARYMVG